jgi:hypothetical protein
MVARPAISRKRWNHQKNEGTWSLPQPQGLRRQQISAVDQLACRRRCRGLLGATGGTRSAHIVELRPVGIEGPGEELAPEGAEVGEGARPSIADAGRGGKRARSDARHDESCLFSGDFCRAKRFLGALTGSFGRKSLKEGFNCRYPYWYW